MGDPSLRKSSALRRLRNQLKKKKESLADHFDFKMYITFHFKEKKKSSAVFEVEEVLPVMTNNYEECIKEGAKNEAYSMESSKELIEKDIVQFHAPRWQPLRRVITEGLLEQIITKNEDYFKDLIGCTADVDYFLWPRNDLAKMECHLFSKWKEESGPYRKLEMDFEFMQQDIEKEAVYLLTRKEDTGLIISNPDQNVFLFIDRLTLQTRQKMVTFLKLASVCIYLPQDHLMCWGTETMEQTLSSLTENTENNN